MCRRRAGSPWIDYPDNGFASMTHYTLPLDFIASCGCVGSSTHYPTAALSQMAYGSSTAFGPGCGRCFNLTLINAFLVDPPFYPNVTKSIVVKVTDLCPKTGRWCSASKDSVNDAGHQLNFDLAWPSSSIPDDFFPSDPSVYGFDDFGVWNISYTSVPCEDSWAGSSNQSDFGAVNYLGSSVCCPTDPFTNTSSTCASYSDLYGIPADATPGVSSFAINALYLSLDTLATIIFSLSVQFSYFFAL
ncbi:endoglucanase v [Pyrrhoderma noxium]|uniref:Endoglucanase v n=1 Tax=Pyrrhoderma noxium TaxID=2282107 RepID=A0A286UGP3_9AGAM|nr:endoglucanase v [Pyrrhoderma noxium]